MSVNPASIPPEIQLACDILGGQVVQHGEKCTESKPDPRDLPPYPSNPAYKGKNGLFPIQSAAAFKDRHITWLVPDILPSGPAVCALFGPSGCGKSFLALDLATTIANGGIWFEKQCKQTSVIYACLEGIGGLGARLCALEQKRQIPACMGFIESKIDLLPDAARLAASIPKNCVLFIDTLAAATIGIDENSSQMKLVTNAALHIALTASCCVVLIHHTGKDREKGLRGHSSLKGALDAAIEVGKGKEGSRWWMVEKSKEAVETGEKTAFTLQAWGESAYVVEGEIEKERIYGKSKDLAFECLIEIGQELVSDETWRELFYAKADGSIPTKRQAYNRAKTKLIENGLVKETTKGIFKALKA